MKLINLATCLAQKSRVSCRRGEWQIKKITTLYSDKRVTLQLFHGTRPDGKPGFHVYISVKPGAIVLPVFEDGTIGMQREWRFAINGYSLGVPGGGYNSSEDACDAVRRELFEETGLSATSLVSLGNTHGHLSIVYSPTQMFVALNVKDSKHDRIKGGTESIDPLERYTWEQAVEMALDPDGPIHHTATKLLILRAYHVLGSPTSSLHANSTSELV